ncbi:polysaccharide pyruvyl transferase family protein [Sinorhizobium meliloti]|uniref:polysaccharide pyruvyl transferase family protein n=1 Tax=Rhizobium meliloti TaxID=382 RepID=UPI0020904565|nr:polysaccharide pyruvyl transferase family protein [Sinorhizobium meliloti]MCO5964842.1 polysaccharide pyruvyl transferase family protein [Sinorhizobium meliloti]
MKHVQLIHRDREALKRAVSSLIGLGTDYALLDFPDYTNVGDSAIWLGSIAIVKEVTGRLPRYVSTYSDFDASALRASLPEGPIFLLGGGNFGDIYVPHQDLRIKVLRGFRDRRIIHLPQSIMFRDESNARETAEAIARHPDFHLFVRDNASLRFVQQNFKCPTTLVPDAAFGLGPLERPRAPKYPVMMLLREDLERVAYDGSLLEAFGDVPRMDWIREHRGFHTLHRLKARPVSLLTRRWTSSDRLVVLNTLAKTRLKRGLSLLAQGDRVITDRLHAHIMCTLMNIEHVAMDNDYGKIHGYIDAWTSSYDGVVKANNPRQAISMLDFLKNRAAQMGKP